VKSLIFVIVIAGLWFVGYRKTTSILREAETLRDEKAGLGVWTLIHGFRLVKPSDPSWDNLKDAHFTEPNNFPELHESKKYFVLEKMSIHEAVLVVYDPIEKSVVAIFRYPI
jgi:hypothetical protein